MSANELKALEILTTLRAKLVAIPFDEYQFNVLLLTVAKHYMLGFIEYCQRDSTYATQIKQVMVDSHLRGKGITMANRIINTIDLLVQMIKTSNIEDIFMDWHNTTFYDLNIPIIKSYDEYITQRNYGLAV